MLSNLCLFLPCSIKDPMMFTCAGVALVAHLLQQRHPRHLTLDLLKALEALLRAVGPAEALRTAVVQRLLLNLRLWAAAPLPIQRSYQALLLRLAKVRAASRMAMIALRAAGSCSSLQAPCRLVLTAHASLELPQFCCLVWSELSACAS